MQSLSFKTFLFLAGLATLNNITLDAAKVTKVPSHQPRSLSSIFKRHWGKIAIGSAIVLVPLAFIFGPKLFAKAEKNILTSIPPLKQRQIDEAFIQANLATPFVFFIDDACSHNSCNGRGFPDHFSIAWAKVNFETADTGQTTFETENSICNPVVCSKIGWTEKKTIVNDPRDYFKECIYGEVPRLKSCLDYWKKLLATQANQVTTSTEHVIRFRNIKEKHPSAEIKVDAILVECLSITFDLKAKAATFHVTKKIYAASTGEREDFKVARKLVEEQSQKASAGAKKLFNACFPQAQEKA